jgi:hypothetical protein
LSVARVKRSAAGLKVIYNPLGKFRRGEDSIISVLLGEGHSLLLGGFTSVILAIFKEAQKSPPVAETFMPT